VSWSAKKVLVTGGGGFIGSHLAEALAGAGAIVRALVHYNALNSSGWLDESAAACGIEVVAGDVRDRDSVRKAMRDVDVVFHLAALIAIPYSYDAPESYVRTNVDGTMNVLQAARDLGTPRVVHTSTSEVYGSACYVPIDEAHPLQAQSPYAASKIAADKLVEAFHLSFGVPIVTVRPFNTFGPRQSARAVIPTIISQCLRRTVVKLGNIHPRRDLSYVTNTVEGFMLAGMSPDAIGRTINLGSGIDVSIGEVAHLIARIMGREIVIEADPGRRRSETSEVDRLLADSGRARTLLGWTPSVQLEDGLRRTIEWMRAHQDEFSVDLYVV
jgi:NAD dependent epimerase/dehydratase